MAVPVAAHPLRQWCECLLPPHTMGGEDLHRLTRKSWGSSQDMLWRRVVPPPFDLVGRWLSCLFKSSSSPTDKLKVVVLKGVTNQGGTCRVKGAVKERCAKSFKHARLVQPVCPCASTLRWGCGGKRGDALQPCAMWWWWVVCWHPLDQSYNKT